MRKCWIEKLLDLLENSKKYMKFRKYKKKSKEDAKKWNKTMGKSNVKDKKKDKSVKKDLEVECFKCGGKEIGRASCRERV